MRIARIAAIYCRQMFGISAITACNTIDELRSLLDVPLQGYWSNHTCFGGTETCGNPVIKQRQADVIIINTIVPLLYVYGKHRKDAVLCEKEWFDNCCKTICENREYTTMRLREMGFEVLHSKANFVFAKSKAIDGETLYLALKKRGVLVRHFNKARIKDFNRITIGTKEQMDILLNAIKEILQELSK